MADKDTMRHEYRTLTEKEQRNMRDIKDCGHSFYVLCDYMGSSREISLAKTKIEEAVMWAVKHITK